MVSHFVQPHAARHRILVHREGSAKAAAFIRPQWLDETNATHTGKQIHYDGARDAECILQIVGIGPATSTSAEEK